MLTLNVLVYGNPTRWYIWTQSLVRCLTVKSREWFGMKKALAVIGLSLFITGCSPQSAAELRANHYQHSTFEVPAPLQTVYQRIYERARLSFYGQFVGSRYRVENSLFPQRKTANVSMFVETRVRNTMLLTIDISAVNDRQTRVDVYRAHDAFAEKFAREVPNWAASDIE